MKAIIITALISGYVGYLIGKVHEWNYLKNTGQLKKVRKKVW